MHSVSLREVSCQCIFKEYFWVLPLGIDWGPNHFGFLNNLVNLNICESLKEIGEMACVTSAWSSRGRTLNINCPGSVSWLIVGPGTSDITVLISIDLKNIVVYSQTPVNYQIPKINSPHTYYEIDLYCNCWQFPEGDRLHVI